jgi:hypothetical protein
MAMFSKPKGLFGAPMMGDLRAAPAAGLVQQDATVPTYKKPSTGQMIAGVLGDTLAQWGGDKGTFLPGLQLRQQYALEGQRMQQEQANKFAGFKQEYDYKLAHPEMNKDDAFTQTLRNAGVDPASPQARQLYMQRAQTLASPAPNFVSDGAGGGRWVQPPAPGFGGGAVPQAPVGKLTPLGGNPGGAPRGGARTFPIR